MVVGVVQGAIQRAEFAVFDKSFDLGGYSLMAERLMCKLESASGFGLPLRNLFERPAVAERLAAAMEAPSWLSKSKAPCYDADDREEIGSGGDRGVRIKDDTIRVVMTWLRIESVCGDHGRPALEPHVEDSARQAAGRY
jgi:hypothetical protein